MTRIAIIGAGPVGLATASWILQHNSQAQLDLFDKLSKDNAALSQGDTRGIAISQGSHILLETIGAWPSQAIPIHHIHISHKGHFGRTTVTREELKEEALGYVVRYADIHLALRTGLQVIAKDASRFHWHFDATTDTLALDESHYDVIVHAEGGLFKQQDWVDIYRNYEQSAIVGWVKCSQNHGHAAWERFTDEGPLALLPHMNGPEYLNLVWCGRPASTQRRLALSHTEFLSELQSMLGNRAGRFLEVGDLRSYELGLNARKEIVQGQHVWIGNAAQTIHPVAGQGLNLGLRDAHSLAQALSQSERVDLALAHYKKSRSLDRRITIGTTDFLARIFTSTWLPVIWARGLALSGLSILTPLKQSITRQMMFGQRS